MESEQKNLELEKLLSSKDHRGLLNWLNEEGNNIELSKLKEVLELFTNQTNKTSFAKAWLGKGENNPKEPLKLKKVLESFTDETNKTSFAKAWLSKDGNNLDFTELKEVLELFIKYNSKNSFAKDWLSKDGNNLDFTELKEVLELFTNETNKFSFAKKWLSKEGNNLKLLELEEVLKLFPNEDCKNSFAKDWLSKEGNNLELPKLKVFLNSSTDEYEKLSIIKAWLGKEKNNLDFTELKEVLKSFKNESKKLSFAENWLSKEKSNLDFTELKEFLELSKNEYQKLFFAEKWLSKEKNNLDFTELKEVSELFTDKTNKRSIVVMWIKKEGDPENKFKKVIEAINRELLLPNKYDFEEIVTKYSIYEFPISKIPDLCTALYPNNQGLQSELFEEFIQQEQDFLNKPNGKGVLKSFVSSLEENELVLKIITAANKKDYLKLPEIEILNLTSNRLAKKYESIKDQLSKKDILSSLTQDGLEAVRGLFCQNADLSNEDSSILDNKTLADLFSYYDVKNQITDYDVKNQITEFKSVVKPEILQTLAESFAPSSKSSYIAQEEYLKLQALFNDPQSPQSNLELPKVEILTNYLSSKLPPIPAIDADQFQFGASEILLPKSPTEVLSSQTAAASSSSQTKPEITEQFRSLLKKAPAEIKSDEVAQFFQNSLKLESPISSDNSSKLLNFFKTNRDQLAFLFQQENGFDKFAGVITSLGDGCVANIATQSKIALYQSIITNPCDQVLFATFQEKISTPILNSGGDRLTGSASGIDIFKTTAITESLISPDGLANALQEQFFKDGKKIRDSWELIGLEIGEGERLYLLENLLESNPQDFEKKAAQIAAYIILQKTCPELLESRYLGEGFKDGLANALQEQFFKDGKKIKNSWEFIGLEVGKDERLYLLKNLLESNPDPQDFEKKAAQVATIEKKAAQIATYIKLQKNCSELLESKYLTQDFKDCGSLVESFKNEKESMEKEAMQKEDKKPPSNSFSLASSLSLNAIEKRKSNDRDGA